MYMGDVENLGGLKKTLKKVGKAAKKVAKVVLPVAAGYAVYKGVQAAVAKPKSSPIDELQPIVVGAQKIATPTPVTPVLTSAANLAAALAPTLASQVVAGASSGWPQYNGQLANPAVNPAYAPNGEEVLDEVRVTASRTNYTPYVLAGLGLLVIAATRGNKGK